MAPHPPHLGLAAKRNVSRFHRAGTSAMLPWVVAPAEDLAKGDDLKLVDAHTVDVIPHGAGKIIKDKDGKDKELTSYRLRLIFADNGALAERQFIEMPKNKILVRQLCQTDGVVKLLDDKGKELATSKGKLSAATAPAQLLPKTKELIVLDLPYRTPQHVGQTLKIEKKDNSQLTFAQATVLLASHVAAGNGNEARNVFPSTLHNRNEKQLGYYVLLAAAGQDLGGQNLNMVDDYPDAPLAQYLALHTSPVLRQHASQWAVGSVQWKDPLLKHLVTTHALYQRWQSKQMEKWNPERLTKEREQALQYVRDNKDSAFGWVLLGLLQNKAGEDKKFYQELAEHWPLFKDSALGYAARYEEARCLSFAGQSEKALQKFTTLYNDTLKDGYLPALDSDFRAALLTGKNAAAWGDLLQTTAQQLIADKKWPAGLALAWQCWQLDDSPQANQLLDTALDNIKDKKVRDGMKLGGVLFYQQTKQFPQADQLLANIFVEPTQADKPGLWRLAAKIASQRGLHARSLECLETALDLEFKNFPDLINVKQVREDYGKLLDHYKNMADAVVALKVGPPSNFLPKVIQTADRWRSLDPKTATACNTAADILMALGQRDLGWDYLTTPIAMQPNESGPWSGLAGSLRKGGEVTLADLAYKTACETDPGNAQLIWDRAENLHQSGKAVQAHALYQQIAEGQGGPMYHGLVAQAKLRLK